MLALLIGKQDGPTLNRRYISERACKSEQDLWEAQLKLLPWIKESDRDTMCAITASMLRDLITPGKDNLWQFVRDTTQKVECYTYLQFEFDGGQHWVMYDVSDKTIHHSWFRKHTLRQEAVEPAMTILELAQSIGKKLDLEVNDDLVVFVPPT